MNTPQTMQAVLLTAHGDYDRLHHRTDHPKPAPGDGEVLIRVHACGLNNTDVNTRVGWYSKSAAVAINADATDARAGGDVDDDAAWGGVAVAFPRVQGADVCGVVCAIGAGVDAESARRLDRARVLVDPWFRDWNHPHDRNRAKYFGSEVDGGFAEYTVAPWQNVHPVSCDLSDAELATFATSSMTAMHMLRRAEVGKGERVLISGASGGVGAALVQLCRRREATVIALCDPSKACAVRAMGADVVLPRTPDDLRAALHNAIGDASVHVVADVVGGALWPQMIDALARGGRYVTSGAIAGPQVTLDLRTLYLNDLTLHGATIPPPEVFAELVDKINHNQLRPQLAATYPLAKLVDAQKAFVAKRHTGNIVVVM